VTSPVPHQALYRRWRAQTFSQIVGQEAVVETLRNAVRADRVAHAILFVGPRGTGKTSLARIVAKAVNCTNLQDGDPCDACPSCVSIREGTTLDVIEIDAASNRGIENVRELRERLAYPPTSLRKKTYILDEAHQITGPAWNALLKSLEEPPPFVLFMFASTEPSGFPPAILSRLQRYDVRRLTVPEIEGKLARILEADRRTADAGAIHLIARLAAGGMRDAESMLDQLLSAGDGPIDETRVRELLGLADTEAVGGFVDSLVTGDVAAGMRILDQLEERGRDSRAFLDQVVDAIRAELLESLGDGVTPARPVASLTAAARRLAAIDPDRNGVGGLRLQLELALFGGATSSPGVAVMAPATAVPVARPTPVVSAPPSTPARTSKEEAPEEPAPPRKRATKQTTEAEPPPSAAAEPRPAPEPEPEPAVAAAPAPAPEAAPPVPSDALEELLAAWPAIVARVSQHPPTKPLIVACRPVAVEGNIVTLGFPEEQAFLKDVAERKKSVIEQGIGESLGRAVAVRCVVANVELASPVAAGDAFLLAEAKRIFADDLVDVGEIT
jgi:DNA polymerase-3 subunit gamma/tau